MYSKRQTKRSIKRMMDDIPDAPNPVWVVIGLIVAVLAVAWLWFDGR